MSIFRYLTTSRGTSKKTAAATSADTPLRGYKVTDAERTRLCGVACRSLNELKTKGCEKLKISAKGLAVLMVDGAIVDDEEFFQTLPPQSVFILLRPGETALTGAELMLSVLTTMNIELLTAGAQARAFLSSRLRETMKRLAEAADTADSAALSARADDPAWFEGLDTRAQTKEQFMAMRSRERVRGYYYKTASEIRAAPPYIKDGDARSFLDAVFAQLRDELRKHDDFACRFDRSAPTGRLCDVRGRFECQGRWDRDLCRYQPPHNINPYSSRETRVLFSTWNLDHCIERRRSVVPALLRSAKGAHGEKEKSAVAAHAFDLLFTERNLKLVHIVCHDKGSHTEATVAQLGTTAPARHIAVS